MSDWLIGIIGVFVFFLFILTAYIGGNWLLSVFRKPKPPSEESIRKYQARLLNPRWAEVEQQIGQAVPNCIKKLYLQTDFICQREIRFRKEGRTYEIARFLPADSQSLNDSWSAVTQSRNFPFAADSFGDIYYVPLEGEPKGACPVMYYRHDGNDFEVVSNSLDEFLGWYRKRPIL